MSYHNIDLVSIHAPVMDAKKFHRCTRWATSFNPRARDGREIHDAVHYKLLDVSIHAPVMDANLSMRPLTTAQSFNPRARDGREDTSSTV